MATPILAAVTDGEPASNTFDELIFKRDLNEVHLLLDFISGRPDSHIWDIDDVKFPDRTDGNGALPTAY
ncbi:hypothetical protein BH160DRAFT_1877 [Burkholderia sp. H160]|nr:hypothetical protein BH160DRAFT_1877 [Burkholderia sp. H160]